MKKKRVRRNKSNPLNYCLGTKLVFVPRENDLPYIRVEQMTKEEIRLENLRINGKG